MIVYTYLISLLGLDFSSNRKIFSYQNTDVKGKKINFNNEEDENINNLNILYDNKTTKTPRGDSNTNKLCCTCSKTNCIKKYCACFANGKFCEGCECKNCKNIPTSSTDMQSINEFTNSKTQKQGNGQNSIICNCTKSNCTKKYCECFKMGKECGPLCRCVGCVNKSCYKGDTQKIEMLSKRNNFYDKGFEMDAQGIEIISNKIKIQKRNVKNYPDSHFGLEFQQTPKVTNKKRVRTKTESTNIKTPSTWSSVNKKNTRSHQQRKKIPTKKLILI